jgi:uncharacterized protein (TIGR00369 family)
MDVIEGIRERLKGMFPDFMGVEYLEATTELIKGSLTVRPELCTVGDILHGGAIMAFADTLGALGTILNLPPTASGTVTIESKTNFLSAAPIGTQVFGEATPLHRGRRTMVWQTRITAEDGKLLAVITQTQLVLE